MLEQLFLTVFNMSIHAGIVILIVMLARLLLKKSPKIFSYVLWSAVLFRLLCPFTIKSNLGLIPGRSTIFGASVKTAQSSGKTDPAYASDTAGGTGADMLPAAAGGTDADMLPATAGGTGADMLPAGGTGADTLPAATGGTGADTLPAAAGGTGADMLPAAAGGTGADMLPAAANTESGAAHAQTDSSSTPEQSAKASGSAMAALQKRFVFIGKYVWLAGIFGMLIYSAVSLYRIRRAAAVSVYLKENIYVSDDLISPFVMGISSPIIYLPDGLSEKEQTYIILHEQHHIRRHDYILKPIAFAALCLHWFNPLAWLAFFLASKDMEMSCDEAVIRSLGDNIRADYSLSLLALATPNYIAGGIPLGFGESDTKSRIRNLAALRKTKKGIRIILCFFAAALILCLISGRRTVLADTDNAQSDIHSFGNYTHPAVTAQPPKIENADSQDRFAYSRYTDSSYLVGHEIYTDILDLYYLTIYADERDERGYTVYNDLPGELFSPYICDPNGHEVGNGNDRRPEQILKHEGFAFIDLNEDGTDELVIGIIDGRDFLTMEDGYVFAIYTVVDGEVVLAVEGGTRYNYRIGSDGYLYFSWNGSAFYGGMHKYRFDPAYEDFLKPIELIGDNMYSIYEANHWYVHIRYDDDPARFELCRSNYLSLTRADLNGCLLSREEYLRIWKLWMDQSKAPIHAVRLSDPEP